MLVRIYPSFSKAALKSSRLRSIRNLCSATSICSCSSRFQSYYSSRQVRICILNWRPSWLVTSELFNFFAISSLSAASIIWTSYSSILCLRYRIVSLIKYCCFCLRDFNSFFAAVNSARISLVARPESFTSISFMIKADFSSICFAVSSCAGVLYLFSLHNHWPSVVLSANALIGSAAPVDYVELADSVILVAHASRGDLLIVGVALSVGFSLAAVVLVVLVAVEDR